MPRRLRPASPDPGSYAFDLGPPQPSTPLDRSPPSLLPVLSVGRCPSREGPSLSLKRRVPRDTSALGRSASPQDHATSLEYGCTTPQLEVNDFSLLQVFRIYLCGDLRGSLPCSVWFDTTVATLPRAHRKTGVQYNVGLYGSWPSLVAAQTPTATALWLRLPMRTVCADQASVVISRQPARGPRGRTGVHCSSSSTDRGKAIASRRFSGSRRQP